MIKSNLQASPDWRPPYSESGMLRIARNADYDDDEGEDELATALQRLARRRLRVNRMMFRGQQLQI